MEWQKTASIRLEQQRNWRNSAMKRECVISMKNSKICDEDFSGVCSTLKAVTDWMQLYTKTCV